MFYCYYYYQCFFVIIFFYGFVLGSPVHITPGFVPQWVEKRRKIFNYYQDNLGDIDGLNFMPEIKNGRSSRWLSVILLEKVNHIKIEDIIRKFSSINIEVRPIWKPMHLQPVFQGTKLYKISKTALSSHLFEHGLCLPSGSGLSNSDQDKIIETIRKEV